jgi:hypothetical protein
MVAEEVIPPLLSVEDANAPDEPDSGCVEKQEEPMGIFQTLDRLEEAVDALLNIKSSASSSALQHHLKVKNSKKLINCTVLVGPWLEQHLAPASADCTVVQSG